MTLRPLETLLATVATLVPEMKGHLVDEPIAAIHLEREDNPAIQDMYRFGESGFPEAGQHYLGLHCWGQLIWQPIYLSVIAVYHSNTLPLLRHVYLPMQEGLVTGYAIRRHLPLNGTQEQRLLWACKQLRSICERLHQTLSGIAKINQHALSCLQADCVLAALLACRSDSTAVSNEQMHERAGLWLDQCGLSGKSSYFEFAQDNGVAMAIHRQTCCHHFRRDNARHCNTCPKLSIDERISRLAAEKAMN